MPSKKRRIYIYSSHSVNYTLLPNATQPLPAFDSWYSGLSKNAREYLYLSVYAIAQFVANAVLKYNVNRYVCHWIPRRTIGGRWLGPVHSPWLVYVLIAPHLCRPAPPPVCLCLNIYLERCFPWDFAIYRPQEHSTLAPKLTGGVRLCAYSCWKHNSCYARLCGNSGKLDKTEKTKKRIKLSLPQSRKWLNMYRTGY